MIHTTFIARISDGLLLCENYDPSDNSLQKSKQKVKSMLKQRLYNQIHDDTQFVEVEEHYLNCKTVDGIIFMVLTDKKYPQKLAKFYLDEIYQAFIEELKNQYGTYNVDFRSKIETIEEPYYFLKFDKTINKKKQEYQDVRSNKNLELLKKDLHNLHNIMSQNIDLILDRDKNLQSMGQKASSLKKNSQELKDKSQQLAWNLWLKKNMVYFIVAFIVLIFLYLKFF